MADPTGTGDLTALAGTLTGAGDEIFSGSGGVTAPVGLLAAAGLVYLAAAGGMSEPLGTLSGEGSVTNRLSVPGCTVSFPVGSFPEENPHVSTLVIPPNGVLYLPPGTYDITAPISWANRPVTIYGDSPCLTKIRQLTAGQPIFSGHYDAFYQGQPEIRGLTLATTVANSAYAIQVDFPVASSIAQICGRYIDLVIQADSPSDPAMGWLGGISLTGSWATVLRDVMINGNLSGSIDPTSRGVSLFGRAAGISHDNVQVFAMATCFETHESGVQGVTYLNCLAVRGTIGYHMNTTPSNRPQPESSFINCHANTDQAGIIISGMPQSIVDGCLLYRAPGSVVPYVGVTLVNGSDVSRIVGTHIVNLPATANCIGVEIDDDANVVIGVTGQTCVPIVHFTTNAANNRYNALTGISCTAVVNDGGGTNIPG